MIIKGTVKKIKYRNGNFAIIQLSKISCDNKVILKKLGRTCDCKLNIACLFENDILEMEFHLENGRYYGEQIVVADTVKVVSDANETAVIQFLKTRGGMKPKNAKEAVENLGLSAVQKISASADCLSFLNLKKGEAEKIHNKLKEFSDYEDISLYFTVASINLEKVQDVIKEYSGLSLITIKTTPYKLTYKNLLTFSECDRLAKTLNIKADSYYRIQSAIYEYLDYNFKTKGNLYEDKSELNNNVNEFLKFYGAFEDSNINVEKVLKEEIQKGYLIEEDGKIYKKYIFNLELNTAAKIKSMADVKIKIDIEKVKNNKDFNKRLDQDQKEAVLNSLTNQISIIAGYAGSGKTTTAKTLIKCAEEQHKKVRLLAPTGKAAERMSEATGKKAETIHRALKLMVDSYETDETLTEDIIIIDEATMIDIQLFNCLINHIWGESQIILLGDPAQLPSVGGGNVFNDLLNSSIIPSKTLTTVHRQAGNSGILKIATQVRNSETLDFNDYSDLKFIKSNFIIKTIKGIYNDLLTKTSPENIVILSGTKKTVDQINYMIQDEFNNNEIALNEELKLKKQDKVIVIKNDYEKDVYNGDVGTVTDISDKVKVEFKEEKTVEFEFDELDELQLAYSLTIHKSQGSEYDYVILVLDNKQTVMLNKNLIYTAITRAKKGLFIIYNDENTIKEKAKIAAEECRKSQLWKKIY